MNVSYIIVGCRCVSGAYTIGTQICHAQMRLMAKLPIETSNTFFLASKMLRSSCSYSLIRMVIINPL